MVVVFVLLGELLRFRKQWRDGGIIALRVFDADESCERGAFEVAATRPAISTCTLAIVRFSFVSATSEFFETTKTQ